MGRKRAPPAARASCPPRESVVEQTRSKVPNFDNYFPKIREHVEPMCRQKAEDYLNRIEAQYDLQRESDNSISSRIEDKIFKQVRERVPRKVVLYSYRGDPRFRKIVDQALLEIRSFEA